MKKIISITLASAIAASALTFAACKPNGDNKNSQPSQVIPQSSVESVVEISIEPSKPEITPAQLSKIESELSGYKSVPKFTCKSEKIDAEAVSENKMLMLVTQNKNDEFYTWVNKQFSTAAKSAGFKKTVSPDTDGTPASYNNALSNSVSDRYNAVILFGNIAKDNISSEIERTQANGIKVLSAGNAGINQNEHYVDNTIPINYQLIGKLLADWTIVKQNGKVNALAVNCSDSGSSNAVLKGFEDEFGGYVSSGYCTALNTSSIEIGNGLTERVKNAILEDINLNYVVVFDDSALNDVISAVEQSGKSINIIATGGSSNAFDSAQNNKIEMLVAQSYEWVAYAMVDYTLRVMNKEEKLPKEQDIPVRIVTGESIKKELESCKDDIDGFYEICFGSAFVEGYSNLWKLGE